MEWRGSYLARTRRRSAVWRVGPSRKPSSWRYENLEGGKTLRNDRDDIGERPDRAFEGGAFHLHADSYYGPVLTRSSRAMGLPGLWTLYLNHTGHAVLVRR